MASTSPAAVDEAEQMPDQFENITEDDLVETPKEEDFEGMIMSANVARNQPDYVRFMAIYQVCPGLYSHYHFPTEATFILNSYYYFLIIYYYFLII